MNVESLVPEAGNLTHFIEQFEVFASAPDGVNKLKSLIINMGVRGDLLKLEPDSKFEHKNLSNIFSLEYGKNLPKKSRSETGEYPVYGSNGVVGSHNEALFKEHCIVIGRKGSAGALNICINKGCWVTDVAYYLIPPDYMDLRYSYYLLLTLNLDQLGQGIKPGLNRNQAYALSVSYPSKKEQKRIVAKVDELMALCDKLEAQQQQQANTVLRANTAAINALLNPSTPETSFEQNWQRIAQHFNTLYGCTLPMPKGEGRKKKHLVGLENVKALRQVIFELAITSKLHNGNVYAGESEKYKEITLKTKEDKLKKGVVKKLKKTSETVFLPEHGFVESWEYLAIGDIFDFIDYRGKTPKKSEYGKRLISAKNIKNGYLSEDPIEFLSDIDYEKWMTRGFPEIGDIFLVTEGHTMGYVAINNRTDEFALAQRTITFQAYYEVNSHFYLYGMMSGFFQNQLIENATGSAAKGVKAAKIKSLQMPVPSLEEQKCIVAKVDQLMTLCDQLEQQLTQSYSDAEKLMQATVKALVALVA